jgi:hypothetical protein
MVESLQRLAPPGEADRAKRRLRRSDNYLGQGVVDGEQRIEGGPDLDWPILADEIAVLQFSDN